MITKAQDIEKDVLVVCLVLSPFEKFKTNCGHGKTDLTNVEEPTIVEDLTASSSLTAIAASECLDENSDAVQERNDHLDDATVIRMVTVGHPAPDCTDDFNFLQIMLNLFKFVCYF